MYTREDYLNKVCTHREFYSQFVTPRTIDYVVQVFGLDRLKKSFEEDEYFNTKLTPLARWDGMQGSMVMDLDTMEKAGACSVRQKNAWTKVRCVSSCTIVCIAKTAARMAIEQAEKETK